MVGSSGHTGTSSHNKEVVRWDTLHKFIDHRLDSWCRHWSLVSLEVGEQLKKLLFGSMWCRKGAQRVVQQPWSTPGKVEPEGAESKVEMGLLNG